MTFYTYLIILTVLLMLAMSLHVGVLSDFTKKQKTWYLVTFTAVMICAVCEYAVHGMVYRASLAPLLTVLTVIQFSLAPILSVLFSGALGVPNQGRAAIAGFAVSFLTEVVCVGSGKIFFFNENGYSRGEWFFIYTVFYLVSLVYLMYMINIVSQRFRHRDNWTIAMVLVIIIAGIVPMALYRLNVTYIAIAISASLMYIYYKDLIQQDIRDELILHQKKVSDMQEHIISGMANLIENRDMETGEHILRTSSYVRKLAETAVEEGVYTDQLNEHVINLYCTLAPLHDVGKIMVSDTILKKPGRLTEAEFEEMKKHAAAGGKIVKDILDGIADGESLTIAEDIATYHHEWWNGKGYPCGLQGEDIPLPARIMAIADVFDALTSERCYKKQMTPEEAFEIIREESGTHFDPNLVRVFLNHKAEYVAIQSGETGSV